MKVSKVLLVDDDCISNNITEELIKRVAFADEVITKTSGAEALTYLSKECHSFGNYPDLIFLDLVMPGMDGFDFIKKFEPLCKSIKKDIVLVILTGSRNPDHFLKLLNIGNYYTVNKPITPTVLENVFHKFFRNRVDNS